jgi:hypothetical protein
MATVTPNFNWPVPTSTDLVKDGATAIEALGDSIDASLVDLKGGTTGQVLSKTSGTDMDFTWVTTDDANAIQNSIVDAKGDLISATANDTPARLAVGANGETLVADSSTSTGLRYQAPYAQQPFLNSAFQVWQRGTTSADSAGAPYTADRWQMFRSGVAGATTTRQVTGDTTNLPNIQYCARVQRNSGNTSTSTIYFAQTLETINSIPFTGKTVTVSFYARKGANYSEASSFLNANLTFGTGTDQNVATGMTGQATVVSANNTLTTTWQRFTMTGTVSSTSTQLALYFSFAGVGTAGAADYFEITGVQLELGSVATPFKTYAATIQGELAACQRYFWQIATGGDKAIGTGFYNSATELDCVFPTPVPMRTAPTLTQTTGTNYYAFGRNGGTDNFNSVTLATIQTTANVIFFYNSTEASGTAGQAGYIQTSNASASLAASAEL